MSIAAVVRALVAAGATPEMILAAVEAAEQSSMDALAARRASDAERQRRYRYPWFDEMFEEQGGTCFYCGDKHGPFHVDHVVPKAHGGAHTRENTVIACAACNLAKSDRTPEKWLGRPQ